MAGAGRRLGELRCWGRRAWPLCYGENLPQRNLRRWTYVRVCKTSPETLGPAASLQKIFCGVTRRRTIEKYPWSVLLCGQFAEASYPRGC